MGSWGTIRGFDTTDDNRHGAMINIDLSERLIEEGKCKVAMWYFSPPLPVEMMFARHGDYQVVDIVQGMMTKAELLKLRDDIDDTLRQLDESDDDDT